MGSLWGTEGLDGDEAIAALVAATGLPWSTCRAMWAIMKGRSDGCVVQVDSLPGSQPIPICMACRHFNDDWPISEDLEEPAASPTCTAFPAGIPVDIIEGGDHRAPRAGDHGILFEPGDNESLVESVLWNLDDDAPGELEV